MYMINFAELRARGFDVQVNDAEILIDPRNGLDNETWEALRHIQDTHDLDERELEDMAEAVVDVINRSAMRQCTRRVPRDWAHKKCKK